MTTLRDASPLAKAMTLAYIREQCAIAGEPFDENEPLTEFDCAPMQVALSALAAFFDGHPERVSDEAAMAAQASFQRGHGWSQILAAALSKVE